jgi:Ca2+/Na+ antiporter
MDPRAILAGVAIFVLVAAFLAIFYSSARQRRQTDIRKALIEKFGSAQDLGAFLQSPGGQRFVSDLFSASNSPAHSVLGSIQKGVIILLVGLTLIGVGVYSERSIVAIGALLSSVGLGFLISAAITHYLSQKWGLLNAPPKHERPL